jgi:hypothetical protein
MLVPYEFWCPSDKAIRRHCDSDAGALPPTEMGRPTGRRLAYSSSLGT